MNEYVFLIRFSTQKILTPEQQALNTEKWGKLIQLWTEEGAFVGSSLITQPGFIVTGSQRQVEQGVVADADFKVTSIIRVLAANLDSAVEMAKACPTLDYEATVEVREVQNRPVQVKKD
ncbi:YciI family protein [Spirosoma litoris]